MILMLHFRSFFLSRSVTIPKNIIHEPADEFFILDVITGVFLTQKNSNQKNLSERVKVASNLYPGNSYNQLGNCFRRHFL